MEVVLNYVVCDGRQSVAAFSEISDRFLSKLLSILSHILDVKPQEVR